VDSNSGPPTLSPSDLDWMTKTVAGEADGDPSAPAVAHVILNRLNSGNFGGNTVPQVVLANKPSWQFTAWRDQGRDLSNLTPSDPKYQRAVRCITIIQNCKHPATLGNLRCRRHRSPKARASKSASMYSMAAIQRWPSPRTATSVAA
jgi:hypothetical protein